MKSHIPPKFNQINLSNHETYPNWRAVRSGPATWTDLWRTTSTSTWAYTPTRAPVSTPFSSSRSSEESLETSRIVSRIWSEMQEILSRVRIAGFGSGRALRGASWGLQFVKWNFRWGGIRNGGGGGLARAGVRGSASDLGGACQRWTVSKEVSEGGFVGVASCSGKVIFKVDRG